MIVVSLFNGMNTGRQALENCGYKVTKYYSSELKPYAIELTQFHFPDTIQVGDVTKWREWDIDWKSVNIILSGSPCQDLSNAGKKAGIYGKKSSLFWVFIEILEHVRSLNPDVIFFQENVGSASKKDIGIMSRAMGIYPVRINSELVTAQSRDRYYWTNIRTKETMFDVVTDIPEPKDQKIMLQDILENGFVSVNKSRAILESEERPLSQQHKMAHRFFSSGFTTVIFKDNETFLRVKEATKIGFVDIANGKCVDLSYPKSKTRRGRSIDEKSNCLLRNNEYFVFNNGDLRYFTKTELCRLQGFPDNYCDILTRNKAASLLGDGWTLPIVEHFFTFLTFEKSLESVGKKTLNKTCY
jgi:site-specific DNA-cytosine methylase